MRQKSLLKTMLLLCALVAGSGSAWADVTDEINNSATSSDLGSTATSSWATDFSITGTSGAVYYIHSMGTKNTTNALQWNANGYLYATKSGGKLKSITVTGTSGKSLAIYAATSAYSAAPTGTALTTMSLTGSAVTYTFEENTAYEFIAIKGKASSTSISSISIVYENGPSISASDVNIASDATSGEIAYTISNPDGSTLTAAEKSSGYDWIDDVTVVSAQNKVTFTTTENTGAAREGYITLTYGSVTKDVKITQAVAVTKYTVTIETPTNGTLVVKRAGTPIATGAQIPDGTELTIELTPADGYRMRNWQAVDASTHTYTANFTYTINAHDVTIKANFEVIPEHTATFYVNGVKDSEANVKEGAAIAFPAIDYATGLEFKGWTTAAISGIQASAPATLVTSATMGNADIDYYAVFAKPIEAFFDASDITATPSSGTRQWTHTDTGAKIYLSAGQHYTSGSPKTFTVTSGTSNYLQVTAPTNYVLSQIIVTLSGNNYKINSVPSGASLSTSGMTQTITFSSSMNSVQCKATSNYQIRATTVTVQAYTYCTTVPNEPVKVTSAGYATFASDFDLDFTNVAGLKAYKATVSGTTISFEKVTTVPAGEGVLLQGVEGSYNVPVAASTVAAWDEDDNAFVRGEGKAVATDNGDGKYNYILNEVGGVVGFYKAAGQTVAKNRAYLQSTTEAARIAISFGEESGIAQIENEKVNADNSVYNLQGQRVVKPSKGLYIVNGKKMFNK